MAWCCPDGRSRCTFPVWQVVLLPEFSIRDSDERIRHLISRSNLVINLVGMRMESMNFTYEEVHTDWPARLAK